MRRTGRRVGALRRKLAYGWRRAACSLRLVAAATIFACAGAWASDYPNRPITLIVPYPAGGSIDLVAREVGEKLRLALGQPVLVQNVGGASGNIGTAQVARAAPDGYTLLLTTNAPLVFNRYILKDTPFDPIADFEPIIFATVTPIAVVVHRDQPMTSFADFLAYAKSHPGEIGFASSGTGSPHHLDGELLKTAAGVDIRHVPYRGASPAINDLAGGHIQAGFITLGLVRQLADSGVLKILAVTDDARSDLAPDVPAIGEIVPAYRGAPTGWHAFLAPRGTPAPIVAKLHDEIARALADPDIKAKLRNAGILVAGGTAADLTARIKAESAVVKDLVAKIGLAPQ